MLEKARHTDHVTGLYKWHRQEITKCNRVSSSAPDRGTVQDLSTAWTWTIGLGDDPHWGVGEFNKDCLLRYYQQGNCLTT